MANRHEVYIWDAEDTPIADDIVALINRVYEAAEDYRSPTPRLLQLATVLEPYINQEEQDDNYYIADYVINQIRQDDNTIPAALCLEMPSSNWKQILYMLIQAATQCQLVVVDTENFLALLPDGSFIPDRAEYLWQDIVSDVGTARLKALDNTMPQTIEQYVKWCLEFYTPFFAKHGFEPYELFQEIDNERYYSLYCHETLVGTQTIKILHQRYENKYSDNDHTNFYDELSVLIEGNIIGHIYNLFNYSGKLISNTEYCSISLADDYYTTDLKSIPFGSVRLENLLSLLEKHLIPILKKTETITELDKLINRYDVNITQLNTTSQDALISLIVSRLANNPRFDELINLIENNKIRSRQFSKFDGFDQVVKYLKEDLHPEYFWQHYPQLAQEEARLRDLDLKSLDAKYSPKSREDLLYLDSLWHDEANNLIWQKCCLGQTWQAGKVIGLPLKLSWDEVLKILADKQNIEQGWRIPTSEEFRNLYIPQKVAYFTQSGIMHYEKPLLHPAIWTSNQPVNINIDFYKQELNFFKMHQKLLNFKSGSELGVRYLELKYSNSYYEATTRCSKFINNGFKLKGAVLLVKSML